MKRDYSKIIATLVTLVICIGICTPIVILGLGIEEERINTYYIGQLIDIDGIVNSTYIFSYYCIKNKYSNDYILHDKRNNIDTILNIPAGWTFVIKEYKLDKE